MVPVLRNCDQLNFAEIEKELISLGNKGKENKISPDDMAGGTFTISNGICLVKRWGFRKHDGHSNYKRSSVCHPRNARHNKQAGRERRLDRS